MGKLPVRTLNVILVNYLVAGIFGFILSGDEFSLSGIFNSGWILPAIILGSSFIFVFNLMATTTQKFGTGTAVVANKMSLVIPVVVAILFFDESHNLVKVCGIVLALAGVAFTMKRKNQPLENLSSYQPLLLFFLSGLIDLSLNQIQEHFLDSESTLLFVPVLFITAFLTGSAFLLIQRKEKSRIPRKQTLLLGLLLGVINYFSIYFLVKALAVENLESSVIFPLNNIGIVLLATLTGVVLFKEKLLPLNILGIILAVLAIILINISF